MQQLTQLPPQKGVRNIAREHNGSSNFKEVPIFSFSYPILLWGVRVGTLMKNTMIREVFCEIWAKMFPPIIEFEYMNRGLKQILYKFMKLNENCTGFRLLFH